MGLHILLCFFWVPSLLASRVYTGVASLASVFGGSIIAMATTALWTQVTTLVSPAQSVRHCVHNLPRSLQYGDAVDTMLVRHALLFAVAQPVVVSIALLAYPIPWRHTPTFQVR